MIQLFLFLMIFLFSIIFIFMNHPISLGFILMIQTLIITLLFGSMTLNFWFSYSLFLIFMGGMLILFMYMTSLASNEIFKFNFMKTMVLISIMILMIMLLVNYHMEMKLFLMNLTKNSENLSMNNLMNSMLLNSLQLNKMFNFPMNMLTLMLMNYLFLTLIASVKITNIFKGPLRQTKLIK